MREKNERERERGKMRERKRAGEKVRERFILTHFLLSLELVLEQERVTGGVRKSTSRKYYSLSFLSLFSSSPVS